MTEKYTLLIYYVHSYFQSVINELKITENTTVENFREQPENEAHCKKVAEHSLTQWEYELSYNQIANGINLLLKSWQKQQGGFSREDFQMFAKALVSGEFKDVTNDSIDE